MDNNFHDKFIDGIKKENPEKLKAAAEVIKNALGPKAKGLEALLSDDKALKELTKKMSPNDLSKLGKLLDNPEMLKMMLSSDKAKEGLKKMLGEDKK